MEFIMILLWGMLISFLGQLPFGGVNMTATQLSVQEGFWPAWKFALGIALIEVIYLRVSLTAMSWVVQHQLFFRILGWVTVVLFLALGVLSFLATKKQTDDKKTLLLNNKINRFFLGASMSAVNPVQIPFWFVWSSYLINNGALQTNNTDYTLFTVGAGCGTLAGLSVYIHGGNWLVTKMKTSNKTLNKVVGMIFILTAFIQLYKMIY